MARLDDLPLEAHRQIYRHLPERARIALSQACRSTRNSSGGFVSKTLVIGDFLATNGDKRAYVQEYLSLAKNVGGITKSFTALKINRGGANLVVTKNSRIDNEQTFDVFHDVARQLSVSQLESYIVRIEVENELNICGLLVGQKSARACSIVAPGMLLTHTIYPALAKCPNLVSIALESTEKKPPYLSLPKYPTSGLLGPLQDQLQTLKIATKNTYLILPDLLVLFNMPNLTQLALTTKGNEFNQWSQECNGPSSKFRPGRKLTYFRLHVHPTEHNEFFAKHFDFTNMKHVHLVITTTDHSTLTSFFARSKRLTSLSLAVNCPTMFQKADLLRGNIHKWGLKRLWIKAPYLKKATWWPDQIKDFLDYFDGLVEVGLTLRWEWGEFRDQAFINWNFPDVRAGIRCFHILNDLESFEVGKPKCMGKVTTDYLISSFLDEAKAGLEPIEELPDDYDTDDEDTWPVPPCKLPCLDAICIGTYRVGQVNGKPVQLKPETWEVIDNKREFWAKRLEHKEFLTRFPDFYGWKYDDEDDIWSDSRGRFWE